MTGNDNWNDYDMNADDDFSDAWEETETDDFDDVEIDIPEEVPVAGSLNNRRQGGSFRDGDEKGPDYSFYGKDRKASDGRPVRKVNPVRDSDKETRPSGRNKKSGNGMMFVIVAAGIIVVAALVFLGIKLFGEDSDTEPTVVFSSSTEAESTVEVTTASWQLNGNTDIVSLINSYYAARTLVDTYTLAQLVDTGITIDQASLENEAEVVEGYQNITCYISQGELVSEWVCYVSYSIKFKNIATPAPGLVAHYIKTDETGSLRLTPWEYVQKDETLCDYIESISDCDTINNLAADVNTRYKQALNSDEDLKAYIVGITGTDVEDDTTAGPFTTTSPTTESGTTETPTTETPTTEPVTTEAEQEAETSFTTVDTMMYITKDGVNVRKAATTDSDIITSLTIGDEVQVTGKGNEWYRVCLYNDGGKIGYIKKTFLSSDKPSTN